MIFTHIKVATMSALCFLMMLQTADAGTIKYVGSSTVGKFMHEAAKVYDAATLDIKTKPESSGGENATTSGNCDIGGVAREVRPEIIARGVEKTLIGKDAIGVWINISNPVANLSTAQLKDIFTGKITNWNQVGGPDNMINVYLVNPQSATRKVFKQIILGKDNYRGKAIQTIRPDHAILDAIAKDEAGIGQLSFAFGTGHPASSKTKKIDIDGQKASVNNPAYPITRPLYLITKSAPQGEAKAFIDWALSDAGQNVVKIYFVGK